MNDESQDTESPLYKPKPHLLAFIDALGFWEEVGKDSTESQRVLEFFKVIDEHLKGLCKLYKDLFKITTIGDSIVLAIEGDSITIRDKLTKLTEAVAEIQRDLAVKDIWIRGAITYEGLHFSKWQVIGHAFSEAHKLEKSVAKFPRVIVDGRVIAAAGADTPKELQCRNLYDFTMENRRTKVKLERDVPTFVDFARCSPEAKDDTSFLKACAEHISRRCRENVKHYAKYRWLADYMQQSLEQQVDLENIPGHPLEDSWRLLRDC